MVTPWLHFPTTLYCGSLSDQQAIKEVKGVQTWKGEVTLSLFSDDTIIFVKNPKNLLIKLNLINKSS